MFSGRGKNQEDYRGGQEQLFLSGVPACAAGNAIGEKESETCEAVAYVEVVVFRFPWEL